jgi:hypothetical protein
MALAGLTGGSRLVVPVRIKSTRKEFSRRKSLVFTYRDGSLLGSASLFRYRGYTATESRLERDFRGTALSEKWRCPEIEHVQVSG